MNEKSIGIGIRVQYVLQSYGLKPSIIPCTDVCNCIAEDINHQTSYKLNFNIKKNISTTTAEFHYFRPYTCPVKLYYTVLGRLKFFRTVFYKTATLLIKTQEVFIVATVPEFLVLQQVRRYSCSLHWWEVPQLLLGSVPLCHWSSKKRATERNPFIGILKRCWEELYRTAWLAQHRPGTVPVFISSHVVQISVGQVCWFGHVELFHASACDVQSLATRTETGEGELGRSRIITSGLVGGKEEEHPCVGQVRVWMLLPDTEWGVELYSC